MTSLFSTQAVAIMRTTEPAIVVKVNVEPARNQDQASITDRLTNAHKPTNDIPRDERNKPHRKEAFNETRSN